MKKKSQNIERKWKRSLIYIQCGKKIEEELTYEKFVKTIDNEYWFKYKDKTIDIAFHHEQDKKIYELNINGYEKDAMRYEFNSPEELLENGRVDGKTLKDIWEDLEN